MTEAKPKSVWRLWRLLAVLLALVMVAAACGGGGDNGQTGTDDEEEGTPQMGGSVTMGLEAESNSFLPGKSALSNPGVNVRDAIFDTLMKLDENGEVRPFLAESLEPNDDLTEWTLKLREGVTFHDGTALNAEALKYNWDNLLTVQGANTLGAIKTTYKVTELQVVDEHTVKYVLEVGNAAFPDLLTGTVGTPFSPAAHQKFGEDAGANPVGTGPFTFNTWERDNKLVVKKWENYWMEDEDGNKLPYLEQITFRPIPDEDTRFQSLLSLDVDAMHSLRQSIVRQARDSAEAGTIKIYEHIGNNGGGAIFNTKRAPVDDPRVRLGLAYAINQEDLVAVLGGEGITPPQTQYFSEDSPFYSEKAAQAWPDNDPAEAKKLLDEYVNDPNRSDGKAVGQPISVQFNCPPDPSLIELSQLYQQFWQAVGVQVDLNQVEQATHIQNALRDEYMINCWRMGGEGDPYGTLAGAFSDPETVVTNFTNYTSDNVQKQLEILRTETDVEKRKAAVESMMVEFTEQVPNLWTGGTATVIAVRPQLKNIDGWKFPDGTKGQGMVSGVTQWGQVWMEQ